MDGLSTTSRTVIESIELLCPIHKHPRECVKNKDCHDNFFYSISRSKTPKSNIFCRPCCGARNIDSGDNSIPLEFYPTAKEALADGKRPCGRCHPTEPSYLPPVVAVVTMIKLLVKFPQTQLGELCKAGDKGKFHGHRVFKEKVKMTPKKLGSAMVKAKRSGISFGEFLSLNHKKTLRRIQECYQMCAAVNFDMNNFLNQYINKGGAKLMRQLKQVDWWSSFEHDFFTPPSNHHHHHHHHTQSFSSEPQDDYEYDSFSDTSPQQPPQQQQQLDLTLAQQSIPTTATNLDSFLTLNQFQSPPPHDYILPYDSTGQLALQSVFYQPTPDMWNKKFFLTPSPSEQSFTSGISYRAQEQTTVKLPLSPDPPSHLSSMCWL